MTEDHKSIHALYCRLTKRDLPLGMSEHLRWNAWKARGWTEADLVLVIEHINSLIAAHRRWPESLRLYNLIDPARFSEDFAEAHALARKPRFSPGKAAVLRTVKRPDEPEQPPAQSAAQILAGKEALKKFTEFGKQL